MGQWLSDNKRQRKGGLIETNNNIKKLWNKFTEEYSEYFHDIKLIEWLEKLERVRKYIITKHKRPTDHSEDVEIKKLGK